MTSDLSGASKNSRQKSLARWLSEWLSDLRRRAMAICLALGFVVALVQLLHVPGIADFMEAQELVVQDKFVRVRDRLFHHRHTSASEIILVCADSESVRRLGIPVDQSLPRRAYALLLKRLEEAGAQVIGLDVPLEKVSVPAKSSLTASIADPWPTLDDDQALAEQLSKAKNVVISSTVDLESHVRSEIYRCPQTPFLEALGTDSGSVGNALIMPDHDGVVRHMPLVFYQFNPSAFFYKSFALRVAEKQLGARAMVDSPERMFLRKHLYPTDVRINFIGPTNTFRMIPLWRALEWEKHYAHHGLFLPSDQSDPNDVQPDDSSEAAQPNPFRDKIVLVGLFDNQSETRGQPANASQPAEGFPTPASAAGIPMSAIEIQANVISNVLHDRFLDESDPSKSALIIMLLAALLGLVLGKFQSRPWLSVGIVLGFSIFWIAAAYVAFSQLHILIPVVVPIAIYLLPCWALVILDAQSFANRERRRRIRVFRTLAAKPLAQEIERKLLAELGLEGKLMNVTVLACQMRDFIGDRKDESAEAVMQRLNASLSVMMTCIGDHHGLVERIWNCGVIGIWGAPIAMAEEKQAKLATECALAMRKRLFDVHDSDDPDAAKNFNFTCGISTGESVCGTINVAARDSSLAHYGALGPAVDLAVELESLNPSYGTAFMLAGTTATLVAQSFEVRELDRVKLGRENAQAVFELLPWEGSLPGALEEAMALFKQGRVSLEEGRVQEAEQLFSTSLRMVPHDKPTMIMLDRCREIIGKVPGAPELVQKLSLKDRLSEGRESP
ncbi:MAG TPA: adenylate/guanylate cyclase domain-containing protein [Trichormus sp.]|jgi:CHASE2 domain-containing sensor protein